MRIATGLLILLAAACSLDATGPSTRQASRAVKNTGKPCGSVTYEGWCPTETRLEFCSDGTLREEDCGQFGGVCDDGFYDARCVTQSSPDAPTAPQNQGCGSVTYEGTCDPSRTSLTYCAWNTVQTLTCAPGTVCGENILAGYRDCVQECACDCGYLYCTCATCPAAVMNCKTPTGGICQCSCDSWSCSCNCPAAGVMTCNVAS